MQEAHNNNKNLITLLLSPKAIYSNYRKPPFPILKNTDAATKREYSSTPLLGISHPNISPTLAIKTREHYPPSTTYAKLTHKGIPTLSPPPHNTKEKEK